MQNLYSYDELIQQIKNCGQSIIDNAESILGDERYFMRVNVSFDILRLKAQVPSIEIKREFTPEKEFEDELTYKELKQRKEDNMEQESNSDFSIIENTREAQDEYGHNYGSDTYYISKEDIKALLDGKQLACNINGNEYSLFIVLKEE